MERTSIARLFQKSNQLFTKFKIEINKILTEEDQIKEVNDVTKRYIEICTLFERLFSLSRTVYGNMTREIIEKLKDIIQKVMLCWRNLRFSSKMLKIHGIENHFFDRVIKYNGI